MAKNFICQQWTTAVQGEAGPLVTTAPARALDTPFQPSTTRPVLVQCTVRVAASLAVSGEGYVELRYGPTNPPLIQVAQVGVEGGGTGVESAVIGSMAVIVPPGNFVEFHQVLGANTSATLRLTLEQAL
jgi:hypothetical protein